MIASKDLFDLPKELKDYFKKIYENDVKLNQVYDTIKKQQEDYFELVRLPRNNKKMQKIDADIKKYIKQGIDYSDEKFKHINSIYDLVDNCIQQLDSNFSKFELELQFNSSSEIQNGNIKNKMTPKTQSRRKTKLNKSKSLNSVSLLRSRQKKMLKKLSRKDKTVKKRSRHNNRNKLVQPKRLATSSTVANAAISGAGIPPSASLVLTLTNNPNEVLDMPTDPYEPVYCTCHDVSYGDMIGCDNPDCPIEWFHFACVGIRENPKGLWYCPRCRP